MDRCERGKAMCAQLRVAMPYVHSSVWESCVWTVPCGKAVCARALSSRVSPHRHYVGVFSTMEYVFLFQFVYAAYRPMATAAGELICKR